MRNRHDLTDRFNIYANKLSLHFSIGSSVALSSASRGASAKALVGLLGSASSGVPE
jgi:hypothetical protein